MFTPVIRVSAVDHRLLRVLYALEDRELVTRNSVGDWVLTPLGEGAVAQLKQEAVESVP